MSVAAPWPRAIATRGSVLVALALGSCGDAPLALPPIADETTYAALPADRDEIEVVIAGRIDDPRPLGHAMPLPWVGLAEVIADGDEIAAGEPIAVLDPGLPEFLMRQDAGRIEEAEAQDRLERLRTSVKLAELEARRDDYIARRGVLEAEIAATRVKDEAQLTIARLERDAADRRASAAADRVQRLRELAAGGLSSAVELARAEQEHRLAEAAAKPVRVKLELLEQTTYAVTRERLRLQHAMLGEDLGDEQEVSGVYAAIASLRAVADKQARIADENLEVLRRDHALRQGVVAAPAILASAGGRVRLRDASVRPGAKLRAAFFAYVLPDGGSGVTFALPERLRDVVRPWSEADPRHGLASIAIDGLGGAYPARVTAIAAAPETDQLGERAYRCEVRFDQAPPELRVGMRARCTLRIPLASPAAVVPTWVLADLANPRATTAAGDERVLEGFAVGGRFVATGGLAPGERLRLATAPPRDGGMRLTGVVEPARFQPVRLSSGEWELLEAVPDGTLVAAGDVIARLNKTAQNNDPQRARFQLEFGHAQAQANLALARIQADEQLSQAAVAWHRAALAVERARLDELVERLATDDEDLARRESELVRAQVRLARARHGAAELDDPALADGISEHARRARRLELARALLTEQAARLDVVAGARARDWITVATAHIATRSAERTAASARAAVSVARAGFQAALARAQNRYRDEVLRLRRHREQISDEVVRAPCAGRVYQRLTWGQPLRIGDDVHTMEPFQIPLGGGRQFTIEVPARFYGRFAAGDQIAFTAPALGAQARTGRILRVAGAFFDSAEAKDRIAERGTVGLPEKVFHLTVAFELAEHEIDRLPPGTTAYVDL
ncbi:MAG TPA: hypothetical protein VEL07_08195 [Planctomycetota bacterium]|nr:hypothetical protein [Planctomycetota bacterium]